MMGANESAPAPMRFTPQFLDELKARLPVSEVVGKRVKLQDHSIFVAFAPKDDPKIAIAVFVENGYWGKRWAGPIVSLMIEKYIKGKITRTDLEKRMLEGSLQAEYDKYLGMGKKAVDSLINVKPKIDSTEIEN